MGRKERSNIVRIEKAVRATKRKYSHKLKDYSRESIPGSLKTTILEHPPLYLAVMNTTPCKKYLALRLAYSGNLEKEKNTLLTVASWQHWQILGFEHYADYVGYSQTNGLSGHTADLDFLFNDDKENYND
jgi:hypothetical protein